MSATLHGRPSPTLEGARAPDDADRASLAALMLSAYAGTVDDEGGETLETALAEIDATLGGDYGPFMPEHSVVVERAGRIVSATLITGWLDRPFVAFSMTDPAFQRQGLARDSLQMAMASLHRAGHQQLSLVVTLANTHAHRLYASLGFVPGR